MRSNLLVLSSLFVFFSATSDDKASGIFDCGVSVATEFSGKDVLENQNGFVCALLPRLGTNEFFVESDLSFGRLKSMGGFPSSIKTLSRIVPPQQYLSFVEATKDQTYGSEFSRFRDYVKNRASQSRINRTYTRAFLKIENTNVVVGDYSFSRGLGFQRNVAGCGLFITKSANFSKSSGIQKIGKGTPIVITRTSKVDCILNGTTLTSRKFLPGVYKVADFMPEMQINNASIKIKDDLDRSVEFVVDLYASKDLMHDDGLDINFAILAPSVWHVDDPTRMKYNNKNIICASNIKYGLSADKTIDFGIQGYKNGLVAESGIIIDTSCGKFSPRCAYSFDKNNLTKNAIAASCYYGIIFEKSLISLDTEVFVKTKGFSTLNNSGCDDNKEYCFDHYLTSFKKFNQSSGTESVEKGLDIRLGFNKLANILDFSFVFNGNWSRHNRYRSYIIAACVKPSNSWSVCASAGLVYDDPAGGKNKKSPDRRLAIGITIPVGDIEFRTSYAYYEDDLYRSIYTAEYNSSHIKGLSLTGEVVVKPDFRLPNASIKYRNEYFDLKVAHNIVNKYQPAKVHEYTDSLFFKTKVTSSGIKSPNKTHYMIINRK